MGVGSKDGHDETAIYEALASVLNQHSPGYEIWIPCLLHC